MRLITGVKNPTEELTVHILFTLVVGYFAALNMTVLFLHVILNASEGSHRVSDKVYTIELFRWDSSLLI